MTLAPRPNHVANCPVCDNECNWTSDGLNENMFLYGSILSRLFSCNRCTHVFCDVAPSEEQLRKFYAHEFHLELKEKAVALEYAAPVHKVWLPFVRKFLATSARGFDLGCGVGGFVWEARQNGLDIIGGDVAEESINFGRGKGNRHIRVQGLECRPEDRGMFDFVTASHVIEHVPDIKIFMDVVTAHLHDGGMLFLKLPSGGYFPAAIDRFKQYNWVGYPMHLNYFTPESIRHFLNKNGYEILEAYCPAGRRQRHWNAEVSGVEEDLIPSLTAMALVDRELCVAARRTLVKKDVPPIQSRPAHHLIGLFAGLSDAWSCLFCDNADIGTPSAYRDMKLVTHDDLSISAYYEAEELLCRIGPNFFHAGAAQSSVARFRPVEGRGIYIIEGRFTMIEQPRSPSKISIFINDRHLVSLDIGTQARHLRLPVKLDDGDHAFVIVSAPESNVNATIDTSLSARLLYKI